MKLSQQLRQCTWLISAIHKAGRITFEELNQEWKKTEMSSGLDLSRTTFNRMRDNVQSMFGVIIDCEKKGGYYYHIYNEEDLNCPMKSPEVCAVCPCNKMDASLLICQPKHCFMNKIVEE